jgi:hypothetical protein
MKIFAFAAIAQLMLVGSALGEASQVLAPSDLSGITFEAVVYDSSPSMSFDNISLKWYDPVNVADLCSEATMAVQADSNVLTALIFTKSDELRCLPEKVAKVAKAKGFSAVVWRSNYLQPGYSAASVWAANNAPIPIFDVIYSSAFQFNVTSSVKLVPIESPYKGIRWFGPQIPLRFLLSCLHLVQLTICARALKGQIEIIRSNKELSPAQSVVVFGIIGAVVEILFNLDLMGQAHIFPLPIWFGLYTWGYMFNFANTFIIAKAILEAEATVRGLRFERRHIIVLDVSFAAFIMINAICTILLGWDVYVKSDVTAVLVGLFLLFQAIVGFHFIISKRRVLNLLQVNAKCRDNAIETVKNLKRMSFFMYISGFFMVAYLLVTVAPILNPDWLRSVPVFIFSIITANIFSALTGLAQVLSLPEKITGIDYSSFARKFTRNHEPVRISTASQVHVEAKNSTELKPPFPDVVKSNDLPPIISSSSEQVSSV